MRISLVSTNANLVEYLKNNKTIAIENSYGSLKNEYSKFLDDLNHVDVFLLVDYTDLFPDIIALNKAITSGEAVLFRPKEIVIITHKIPEKSPTKDITDRLSVFVSFLEDSNFKVRVELLEDISFNSIYNSVIKTSSSEEDIKIYTKYKVSSTDSGQIARKPKKTGKSILPELGRDPKSLKKKDEKTASILADTSIVRSPNEIKINRKDESLIKLPNQIYQPNIIFCVGHRYSGKTTLTIKLANEFTNLSVPALIIDATGKKDYKLLMQVNNSKYPILRGKELFNGTETKLINFIELEKEALTIDYIQELTFLTQSVSYIIEECSIEYLKYHYFSTQGSRKILMIVNYSAKEMSDVKAIINKLDLPVTLIVRAEDSVDISKLVSMSDNIEKVINFDDITEICENLGV